MRFPFPLAVFGSVAEIERTTSGPIADWWDFGGIAAQIRKNEMYPIRGGGSEPFLIYKNLRGQEQAFIDLIENPEIVHYCLDKLFDLAYETSARIFEAIPGRVMISYVAEDMGGQTDLMISVRHIREFLLPGMKRMIDLAHQAGAYVFHHNDGSCRRIIPELIDARHRSAQPAPMALSGHGAGAAQTRFRRDSRPPRRHGQPVHASVRDRSTRSGRKSMDNLRILGAGGGYILAPCHNIQAITPPENVVAMYETAHENGWAGSYGRDRLPRVLNSGVSRFHEALKRS